jgi:acyl-CoA thioesterase-1
MANIKVRRPGQGSAGSRHRTAKLIGFLGFLLNLGLAAPAFASDLCPKSPEVFAPNGAWAKTYLGGKTSELRILAIGSSSTEGVGASQPSRSYPADLKALLSARFPALSIHVVNAGIGGETAHQTIFRLETALATGGYDLVIWQVGTNDAVENVNYDAFRAILERGISAAQRAGTPLILADPQYYPDASHRKDYGNFVGIVDEVGKERGIPVFSRYALMQAWASDSAGLLSTMLSKDSFHMSDRGYACWASLLADEIAGRMPGILATSKDREAKDLMPVVAKSTTHAPLPAP